MKRSTDEGPARKRLKTGGVSPSTTWRGVSPPDNRYTSKIGPLSELRGAPTLAGRKSASSTVTSPFQLTRIAGLPEEANIDTVGLGDILGDPLIKECWNFNFLFDLDFIMRHLDPDVRHICQIHIVHGSWKREDANRQHLESASSHWPNVRLIAAHMPEAFGTHHSKMMILIRHDETMQVIVHTANMLERDWRNMTQAVWRSPCLPSTSVTNDDVNISKHSSSPIGSGRRFKFDLTSYLAAYGNRLRPLIEQLATYDFSAVKAAFISSYPGRYSLNDHVGWLGMRRLLSSVRCNNGEPEGEKRPANLVVQVSSIASLGQTDEWLKRLMSTLSTEHRVTKTLSAKGPQKLQTRIIFPTPREIRDSLDGYSSGGSIHTKLHNAAAHKQLQYLRPMLCHWDARPDLPTCSATRDAMRETAAPHIKTYIRFSSEAQDRVDWAMLTSANLSTQAWGGLESKTDNKIRVCSYETGVVVWPALWDEDAEMVPVYGKDNPAEDDPSLSQGQEDLQVDRIPNPAPFSDAHESQRPMEEPRVTLLSGFYQNLGKSLPKLPVNEDASEDDGETEDDARTATTVDDSETEDVPVSSAQANEHASKCSDRPIAPYSDDEGTAEDESDGEAGQPGLKTTTIREKMPAVTDVPIAPGSTKSSPPVQQISGRSSARVRVGLRMPYSLPLVSYGPDELPWVASANYTEPDRHGNTWT